MLTINRVTYGDAGQYTCSAKNSWGKNEAASHTTVTVKRWRTFVSFSFYSHFLIFFILSPFLTYTFEFYAQVLLKLILSSRISRLHITRRFSSFALWAVSLHLRYSGLRMGWISVTTTLTRFVKQDLKTLVNTHAVPKTAKGAKTQLSGSKWREVPFSFIYIKCWSR